jgi:hypothetical protein
MGLVCRCRTRAGPTIRNLRRFRLQTGLLASLSGLDSGEAHPHRTDLNDLGNPGAVRGRFPQDSAI